jgi:hypothetical protein
MSTMADSSPMLAPGTYVRVDKQPVWQGTRDNVTIPAKTYIGVIVGTDMFRSKYQVGARFGGWGEWLFMDGGSWAFPHEVTVISEEEALRTPSEVSDS